MNLPPTPRYFEGIITEVNSQINEISTELQQSNQEYDTAISTAKKFAILAEACFQDSKHKTGDKVQAVIETMKNARELLEGKMKDAQRLLADAERNRKQDQKQKGKPKKRLKGSRWQWTNGRLRVRKLPMDKIKLNIGRKKYHVTRETLLAVDGTFFSNFFSGRWNTKVDDKGYIHVDRDGTHYNYIFNYLREGDKAVLPMEEDVRRLLRHEAEFLGMEKLIKMLNVPSRAPVPTQPDPAADTRCLLRSWQ